MAVIDGGTSSAGKANVDANFNLQINLPGATLAGVSQGGGADAAGFVALGVEEDSGVVTGTRKIKKLLACEDGALTVGQHTRLFSENFPGLNVNTTLWASPVVTMTVTQAANFLVLNGGLATTSAAVARVSSWRHFPLDSGGHLIAQFVAQFAQVPVSNNITEWGLGLATGTSAPTDGVFFRLNAAGEFRAVVNNNGSEVQSGTLNFASLVGANVSQEFYIIINDYSAQFKIGHDIVAEVSLPTGGGSLTSAQMLPVLLRTYNTAATASAQVLRVGTVNVKLDMTDTSKPWDAILAGYGGHASQGQTGQTLGTTAKYPNSSTSTAAVPTNNTAALGNGLGGEFWETDTLAVQTDGIISSYQVPLGTATAPGKSLYITGLGISSYVQTALVGGPYVAQWSLAYGHTSVGLGTTETATSKAARRFPLPYTQPVTAAQAVNTAVGQPFYMVLPTPIVVNPGEFIQLVKKKTGTAPSAGVVAHVISIEGYME